MPVYTQDNRCAQLITPLGKDVLLLRSFCGQEGISKLFHFELRMFSENRSISFASLVGKNAAIRLKIKDGLETFIHGVFSSFAQEGVEFIESGTSVIALANYTATLVPWPWLLTRTRDCRIFQNKTVPDIIEATFTDHGFKDYALRLHGNFLPRNYCVQYRETDFNFVSRLMEEEGIFYFFEHEATKHTLVLADHTSEFKPSPVWPCAFFRPTDAGGTAAEVIKEFTLSQEVRPGEVTLRDFNFEQPFNDLTSGVAGKDDRHFEIYDYPGAYTNRDQGDQIVGIRMQEEETTLLQIQGSSNCLGFACGCRFDLKEHYRKDFNKTYVHTSLFHYFDQSEGYHSTSRPPAPDFNYSNSFQCIPYPVPFRPLRKSPVPVVHGSQTAIVVGPKGEEIFVDKYGRVKVQFHWDRLGRYDDDSSCWIRVSQNWAGKGWGAMMIPRIGQEVIVDFLEGNPDQPIITGRVYNGETMPPYTLPDEMTVTTLKSCSSKGGGGFNEIRFEDKKGSEQLFLFAQRNQDNRTTSDSMEYVGQDRHLIVKRDQLARVEGDQHLQVKGDKNEKVAGTVSLNSGTDIQLKAQQNYALDSGIEVHIKAGMNLVIESGTTLTLKVGGNFVNLNSGGVFIKGSMVMINSGGAPGSGAGASPGTPKDPQEADSAKPGEVSSPPAVPKPVRYSPAALVLKNAAQNGAPFCDT